MKLNFRSMGCDAFQNWFCHRRVPLRDGSVIPVDICCVGDGSVHAVFIRERNWKLLGCWIRRRFLCAMVDGDLKLAIAVVNFQYCRGDGGDWVLYKLFR